MALLLPHAPAQSSRDPEFVQFHPTALDIGEDPAPLATEALRGEGAKLVSKDGTPFMAAYHRDEDLAPRDIVARAVEAEIAKSDGAFLDARTAIGGAFPDSFPTVFGACQKGGIDPRTELMPVAPAAHYHMGGIMTDLDGRATIDGLWAVGEVASTGVHGANRLASNSLLEAVVFGARIADALREKEVSHPHEPGAPADRMELPSKPGDPKRLKKLRKAMTKGCALIRTEKSLTKVLSVIDELNHDEDITSGMRSALVTAELIAQAALMREESRGAHHRADFPDAEAEPMHTEICATAMLEDDGETAEDWDDD